MRLLRAGSSAVLVELEDLPAVLALRSALDPGRRLGVLAGVTEVVPAARTLLLRWDARPAPDLPALEEALDRALDRALPGGAEGGPHHPGDDGARTVEVPVVYDGEDLPDVARLVGLPAAEVVRRHAATPWSVAFTGFAPGFAYLVGGDPVLRAPRRREPRTRVPAGAVGLAGEFSGVYPRASPGGWQLLGRTDLPVWDPAREPPALLRPGTRVRFTPSAASPSTHPARDHGQSATRGPARHPGSLPRGGLEVLDPGPSTVVTDLGRPGRADVGVSPGGARDRGALRAANRAVGGAAGAPALEAAGPLAVRSLGRLVVAVAGADVVVEVVRARGTGGGRVPPGVPVALDDGDIVTAGPCAAGAACYLAVRGGLDAPRVLGSAATDVLSGLGPPPLRAGDVLAVAGPRWLEAAVPLVPQRRPGPALPRAGATAVLDVVLGPREDWFTPAALELLLRQPWRVTARGDRVGVRLEGARPLERTEPGRELPSEPAVRGALQVPPSGQPVLFGPDHPVTGGYPVIACVAAHHLDLAGQLPPGADVLLREHRPG
ncbi:5-oxoprolinase subunit B/C family protein [Quadrisphaera sp. KR29]|uniref:5-oxoprolinase subunit B/C family protein n=1 Tax=Quadrisphaera sp. KR29 TaxID=3461391 RepID=UPI004044AD25